MCALCQYRKEKFSKKHLKGAKMKVLKKVVKIISQIEKFEDLGYSEC